MKKAAVMIGKASACHQAGQFAKAERLYRDILKLDGQHAGALRQLGLLCLQISQPERAEHFLERAQRSEPGNPEILIGLGVACRNQGKRDAALHWHVQAQRAKPDSPLVYNNIGGLYLERGNWHDAALNFAHALRLKPDYAEAHYNLGKVFRAQRKNTEALARFREAVHLKPDYAEALLDLGVMLFEYNRLDQAAACYQKLLSLQPHNVQALNNLGNVLRQTGRAEEALKLYGRALELKPDYHEAHLNYGTALRDLDRFDAARERFESALRHKPDYTGAFVNLGALEQDWGRPEKALAYHDGALDVDPDSVDAAWNKALCLLALGRFREGWALYEKGLGHAGLRGPFAHTTKRWDGGALSGKRLLIWSEQGLGDAMQFVRYAALCKEKGGEIIVQCPAPLVRLFQNCPFIDKVVTESGEHEFDFQISMMSLPLLFGTEEGNIPSAVPYLFVDEESREKWAPRFTDGNRFKVGIVWAGNAREHLVNAHLIDRRRSVHLDHMHPLLDVEGVTFYSLQLDKPSAQIVERGMQDKMIDFTQDIVDFADTAALIERLDLVISVDTSVAHLAGGLGKPVWILSRRDACWRWLQNRESNPWYPTARVFGQAEPGQWEPVIGKVREALAAAAKR